MSLLFFVSSKIEYVPTVFDNYAVDLVISGNSYTLALFDTGLNLIINPLSSISIYQILKQLDLIN